MMCQVGELGQRPPDSEERRWIEAAVREPVGTRWNAISQVTDQTEYGDYGQSAEWPEGVMGLGEGAPRWMMPVLGFCT